MKKKDIVSAIVFFFLFASLLSVTADKQKKDNATKLPDNVKSIIDKSCFDCHNTDSRNEDAKEELDFKKINSLSLMKKVSAYKHIRETIEENEMPPKKFLKKNPEKKLTNKERNILIAWAKKEAKTLVKSK